MLNYKNVKRVTLTQFSEQTLQLLDYSQYFMKKWNSEWLQKITKECFASEEYNDIDELIEVS